MIVEREPDLNRILGGIYVGGIQPISEHVPLHGKWEITHILSIIKFEVIPEYLVRKSYTLKNISIDDDLHTNILEYFNESNRFLDNCLYPNELEYDPAKVDFRKKPHGGNVYIHCQAGVSRSVSFTIAYLMYRYRLNLKTALHAVKRKRPMSQPNDNFMEQLQLYEDMGSRYVDGNNQLYKQWLLKNSVKLDPTGSEILSHDETFKKDEEKDFESMTPEEQTQVKVARCKKCRQKLALSTSFIPHSPPSKQSSEGHFIRRAAGSHRIIGIEASQNQCSHYFVEPMNWMKDELQAKQELEGKFGCPGCHRKVGGYNWKGSRCSCGKWVIPAIHLQSDKVDLMSLRGPSLAPNVTK
ncbi:hypothetical protein ZYGR_0N00120 [Zygosaccharomyces rouxii]|uniref:protein-tyrosine-phosphatase n=2 Tax=Zygosaccharomyces rouxii TaxID=4956 RepID=C5DUR2_ZYGRC|nr:uncharacterized protein ZYRO0D00682g [Zygosaccharomyces rouxii]KAH9200448.1 protein-tyrosine phosphatase-like protein [Zygosaccharomyces rouxii]GAV48608.1 hypothetical protein ZYGR_0N00120 [Zygosaccharomyces rouxii]CAR27531.1 ZYRO0D00682p [Zygosaccharomyces rouxii]